MVIKKIETRLFDDKIKRIKVGDEIIFSQNDNPNINQTVRVIGLLNYSSFEELFSNHLELFGGDTKESLINEIYCFYSEEKEKQYGVIGIHIELIG